jgi:hypothetical protein
MIRRTLLLLLALVLAAGMTACGGGGGGGGDDDAGSAEDESAEPDRSDAETDEPAEDGDDAGSEGESVASQLGVDRTFTGEGSEEFCAEVGAMEETYEGETDDLEFAQQMSEITPPAEIADEWTNLYSILLEIGNDPSGEGLLGLDPEAGDTWAMDGAVVAAYLGDVCGMSG